MATDTLSIVSGQANSELELSRLIADIQVQAGRIDSLAEAIDEALDIAPANPDHLSALTRTLDYVHLIQEAAAKVKVAGEQAEIRELRTRRR